MTLQKATPGVRLGADRARQRSWLHRRRQLRRLRGSGDPLTDRRSRRVIVADVLVIVADVGVLRVRRPERRLLLVARRFGSHACRQVRGRRLAHSVGRSLLVGVSSPGEGDAAIDAQPLQKDLWGRRENTTRSSSERCKRGPARSRARRVVPHLIAEDLAQQRSVGTGNVRVRKVEGFRGELVNLRVGRLER